MREARTAAGLGVAIITHRYSATNAATGASTAAAWPVLTPSSNIWTTGKATKIRKTTRAMLPPGPSRALRSAGGTSRDVVSVMSASWRTGPRSAEPAFTPQDRRREGHPGDGPAREDEQVGRVDPRAGRARIEGDLEAVREVLDREGGGDGRQPTGQRAEVTPDAGDEGERQDADVRDHARRVGVRDEAQDRDAQGAEACGSGHEREDEAGQRLAADLDPVGHGGDHQRDRRHDDGDHDRGSHARADEGPARQRRAPQALEDARLAQDRELARDVRERGHDHAVGEEAGDDVDVRGDAAAVAEHLAVIERAEDQEKHERQREAEEGAASVTPERALVGDELPEPEVQVERRHEVGLQASVRVR